MAKLFFETLDNKISSVMDFIPPIWLMRQAGRYLPEYLEVRAKMGNFLDLCYSPKFASEVTLQPIKRFDFDAAIIFSDILVIADSLGIKVDFEENIGPIVENIANEQEISKLKLDDQNEKLLKVYEAINLTRASLPQNKSLIGFAGGAWTVASYIFANNDLKDKFEPACLIAFQNPDFVEKLIEIIAEQTASHLINQIDAGCDVVQIFESWAGLLPEAEFERFIIKPTKYITSKVKSKFPNVKIIGFPRASGYLYERYIRETGIDAVSIDQYVPLEQMRKFQNEVVVQGNLSPLVLFSTKEKIKEEVLKIKNALSGKPYIFNLGHGILPKTPIENVEYMIESVRGLV
jgi:uroporphyrinogen decarboxylase